MNLIRLIALELEHLREPALASAIRIEEYESDEIVYHVALMLDSDLIGVYEKSDSAADYVVTRLTNSGHDFVEYYRDEEKWLNALGYVRSKSGVVTFSMLNAYTKVQIEEMLNNSLD